MEKAALIEIGGSHSECLYTQLLFLKSSSYRVHLICSENLSEHLKNFNMNLPIHYFSLGKGQANDWKSLIDIKKYLISNRFGKVIFNTAGGNLIRNLLSFHFPKEIEFIGVLHDINKLTQSFTQKLINRKIKKYFVLNDYIIDSFISAGLFNIESFYPICFPDYNNLILSKKEDEFWICVPGSVEYKRRDYLGLIKRLEFEKTNENVKFIFLGKSKHFNSDAEDLKKNIRKIKMEKHFMFFDDYIPDEVFHNYIEKSEIIMPLIHESHSIFKEINGFKISGSFNLAFAHKKPLLCEDSLEKFDDFRENAIFYNRGNMIEIINTISSNSKKIEDLSKRIYKNLKWSFDFQKNKYISFIERNT